MIRDNQQPNLGVIVRGDRHFQMGLQVAVVAVEFRLIDREQHFVFIGLACRPWLETPAGPQSVRVSSSRK